MHIGLSTGITSGVETTVSGGGSGSSFVQALGSRAGFAIDFVAGTMRINDPNNPANNFTGHPEVKLTRFGADGYLYDPAKGIVLDAARDFGIALSTALFPYNPAACTVYMAYQVNALTSPDQRYLFMADNAGNDRFANYSVSGGAFRFVSGDGASADISLSDTIPAPGVPQRVMFGADAGGKTYVDEAGIQGDSADTLAADTPAHVGIGGYNNQVLRVLDGHIAQIMVVCEPVEKADRLSLDLSGWGAAQAPAPVPPAFDILGARDGLAIDFVAKRMKINDSTTPANDFDGDPEAKLTVFGADGYQYDPVRGISLDGARDFSIALSTALFPFNPSACTVYAKYRVNAATSTEQRYLFMTDNAGVDRFALYAVSGAPFRFVTGDGVAADIAVSSQDFVADTEYTVVFGADSFGKTFIDGAGVQADGPEVLQSASPIHVGIGGYNDRVLRVLDGHITEIVVVCEPLPRPARLTLAPFGQVYKAEGDSHTFNTSFLAPGEEFYPALVTSDLSGVAASGNFGWSGDSTAEMVNQLPTYFADGLPDIATIYGGANDGPVSILAAPAPTASTFTVDQSARLAVDGWVVVNGESRQIVGKSGDEITVSPALSAVPSGSDQVEIDTQKNIEAWIDAVQAAGVSRVMVIGYHYMNWASGGDTPTTEHPNRAALRAKQAAAAASRGVPFCDTFTHMRAAVVAGDVVQGDDLSWHVAVGNTHLNAAGERAVADAVRDAFIAEGWDS